MMEFNRRLFMKNFATMLVALSGIEAIILLFPLKMAILASVVIAAIVSIIVSMDTKGTAGNPFAKLKELGAHMALVVLPSERRIVMIPTKKELAENKIVLKTLYRGKLVPKEITLGPNTEFTLEVPEMKLDDGNAQPENIKIDPAEGLKDGLISIELQDPHKQTWHLDPIQVDASLIVFPDNTISKEQLQAWYAERSEEKTITVEEEVEENGIPRKIEREIKIPAFKPKPYALDVDSARTFSAVHRGAKIETAIDGARKLLGSSDSMNVAVAGGKVGGILSKIITIIAANPLLLVVGAAILLMMLALPSIVGPILTKLSAGAQVAGTGVAGAAKAASELNAAARWPP